MSATVIQFRPAAATRLSIDLLDDGAILRVLTVARQRGFVLTAVDFAAGDRHRPPRLEIAVSGGDAGRLAVWLERLVEVASVTSRR